MTQPSGTVEPRPPYLNDGELMGMEPTHRAVELSGITIGRVEDGEIAEDWEQYDALG